MNKNYVFTSESVSEGHPDKVCDRVSDAILDYFIKKHPESRVACECFVTTNKLIIGGEVRCPYIMDGDTDSLKPAIRYEIIEVARQAVRDIGYEQNGFHWETMDVQCLLHGQSSEIARGVDESKNKKEGAGDQGIMFGYATNETLYFMPAPIHYAHAIMRDLNELRKSANNPGLYPDMKSQVTMNYCGGKPVSVNNIVVSAQHDENLSLGELRDIITERVSIIFPNERFIDSKKLRINPAGEFTNGGPSADVGLTGRKIIVDTYGGSAPHGGGAFSGKDPTKVDRSAAYAARWVAKNVVAAGLADKCLIQLSYAIGKSEVLSIYVDTYGTGVIKDSLLANVIGKEIDLTPKGIRQALQLNRPIYTSTSAYGHFGRAVRDDGAFSWESLTLEEQLKNALK